MNNLKMIKRFTINTAGRDFGVEHFTGHYHSTGNGTAYGSSGVPGWFCSVYEQYSGMEMVRVQVTHWMPIPKDPA